MLVLVNLLAAASTIDGLLATTGDSRLGATGISGLVKAKETCLGSRCQVSTVVGSTNEVGKNLERALLLGLEGNARHGLGWLVGRLGVLNQHAEAIVGIGIVPALFYRHDNIFGDARKGFGHTRPTLHLSLFPKFKGSSHSRVVMATNLIF